MFKHTGCSIAGGKAGFSLTAGFAANGYAEHSPGGYSMLAGLVSESVLTFMFLFIFWGATDRRPPAALAPVAMGFGLSLVHLIGDPVTNLSVNPARSTGSALYIAGWAIAQLWLFQLAPLIGASAAGLVSPAVAREKAAAPEITPQQVVS